MTTEDGEVDASRDATAHTFDGLRARRRLSSKRERRAIFDGLPNNRLFLAVFLPVFAVYLATASWFNALSPDTYLNSLTGYTIANEGTVFLDSHASHRFTSNGMWIVDAEDDQITSQYPPAAAAHSAPFYWLSGASLRPGRLLALSDETLAERERRGCEPWPTACEALPPEDYIIEVRTVDAPPIWPAALTAALVTALAMGFLALTFRALVSGSLAAAAAYLAAFGTSAWSVGADELWQHSAGMLWIALGGYAVSRSRTALAGVAYAVAIAVRPLSAAIACGTPLVALLRRNWKAVVGISIGIAAGLTWVIGYNAVVFGQPSISGGYGPERSSGLLETSPTWLIANYAKGLVAPRYGLLIWSPFLVVLALGLPAAWKASPPWVRGPAIGAGVYLVLHWTLNRASGGAAYFFYRYPLESLTAAAPLLLLAYVHGVQGNASRVKLFRYTAVVAIAAHAMASITWLFDG